MRYHNITKCDLVNGKGLRVTLWVSGCEHHCYKCQNPITWNPDDGLIFDKEAEEELFTACEEPYIRGLTLCGGDPLYPGNRKDILELVQRFKARLPHKDIWCYTGYEYEEVKDLEIMNYIDVLVDGKYVDALRDVNYHWAGSTNQRVINIKQIRKEKLNASKNLEEEQ